MLIAGSGTPARAAAEGADASAATRARSTRRTAWPTRDFLRVVRQGLSRAPSLPAGPVLVAEQLPANHPVQEVGAGLRRQVREGATARAARRPVRRPRLGRRRAAARRRCRWR
ncbi:MAG: hypothetical protein MZW92_69230 [Comamonadaceae bacterium]|nr:hypothetical protein [Comamonadaceae bacterium]